MFSHRNKCAVRNGKTAERDPNPGTTAGGVTPFRTSPQDFSEGCVFLSTVIQSRVVERLEQIFEHVRQIDECVKEKAKRRRAIRLPEVLDMLGISKSTMYSRLNLKSLYYDQAMPKPFKLGNCRIADRAPSMWWESDVQAYLELHADVRQRS